MNVRKPFLSFSKNSRPASDLWREDRRSKRAVFLLAACVHACFWAVPICDAQIEVNAYISNNTPTGVPGSVTVIDTNTQTPLPAISVGTEPFGVATSPDGRFVYVANVVSNTVSVINADTNAIGPTIPVGNRPFGVAVSPDAKFAYVTNSADNTVSVIDTATNTVVGPPISVGTTPFGIAVTPNGSFAYVANNGKHLDGTFSAGTVSVINTATNMVVETISVGSQPQGVAISPNGQFVYVSNLGSNSVSKISTADNVVTDIPIPAGASQGAGTQFGKRPGALNDSRIEICAGVIDGQGRRSEIHDAPCAV